MDGSNFLVNMFLFFACFFFNISGNKYGTELETAKSGKPVALVFRIKLDTRLDIIFLIQISVFLWVQMIYVAFVLHMFKNH